MHSIVFHLDRPYTAHIGAGAAALLSEQLCSVIPGETAAIVTDSGVPSRHVRLISGIVQSAGKRAPVFTLPQGESNKNAQRLLDLYSFLYENGLTRSCGVIAVGGGVVGDIAGFAASTYLRGVGFINVPTTIIAQTDSAYGGKTGIDLGEGKNHVGSFYQPGAVICDTEFLKTLDHAVRLCGMGEVIKYGAIASPELLDSLTLAGSALPDETTIAGCVDIKRRFVEADPYDLGERRILNFGHTIGHAVEASTGYSVPHGQAVSYGMLAAAELGFLLGVTAEGTGERIASAASSVGLDTDWRAHTAAALPLICHDKKADSGEVDFVLLRQIGDPFRMRIGIDTIGELISK